MSATSRGHHANSETSILKMIIKTKLQIKLIGVFHAVKNNRVKKIMVIKMFKIQSF